MRSKLLFSLIVGMLVLMSLGASAYAEDDSETAEIELITAETNGDEIETEAETVDVEESVTEAEIDEAEGVDETGECTDDHIPVCGEDGTTYANQCKADEAGIIALYGGECDTDAEKTDFEPPSELRETNVCETTFGKTIEEIREEVEEKNRIRISHLQDKWKAKMVLVGMDAVIEIASENGADTTELEEKRDEFETLMNDMINHVDNPEEYRSKTKEMTTIGGEFKTTARATEELEGKKEEIDARIKEKRDALKEEVAEEKQEAIDKAEEMALKVFDLHTCTAEEKINKFYNIGFDTTKLDSRLEELKELRPDLETAQEEDDRETAKEINKNAKDLWNDLRKKSLAKEGAKKQVEFNRQVKNIRNRVAAMELGGADAEAIDDLNERLEDMRDKMIKAQSQLSRGDKKAAEKHLKKGAEKLTDFKGEYDKRVEQEKAAGRIREPVKIRKDEAKEAKKAIETRAIIKKVQNIDLENIADAKPRVLAHIKRAQEIDTSKKGWEQEDKSRIDAIKNIDVRNPKNLRQEDINKIKAVQNVKPKPIQVEREQVEKNTRLPAPKPAAQAIPKPATAPLRR